MSFLDVEIFRENDKFVRTVYRRPNFSGVYTQFESFLFSAHKFVMLFTLVYGCFTLYSNWTKFCDIEINFPKEWLFDIIYRSVFREVCKWFTYSKICFSES